MFSETYYMYLYIWHFVFPVCRVNMFPSNNCSGRLFPFSSTYTWIDEVLSSKTSSQPLRTYCDRWLSFQSVDHTMRCDTIRGNTILYDAMRYNAIPCDSKWYTIRRGKMRRDETRLYNTIQWNTATSNIVLGTMDTQSTSTPDTRGHILSPTCG